MQQLAAHQAPRLPLYVHDVGASMSFYCEVIRARVLNAANGRAHMQLPDGSTLDLVDLHQGCPASETGGAVQPTFEEWYSRRVRCSVSGASLGDWERHLFINGVVVNRNYTDDSNDVDLCFADPDGNLLILVGAPDVG